ncbi:MAG: LysE family translocator [Pseudomonadota bacterium]
MFEAIIALFVFAFVGAGTPGPNNVMLMASGMNYGFRRSLSHIAGVAYGLPLMIIAIGLGLSSVFAALPWLEQALRIACAVYLVYLAYKIATARPTVTADGLEVTGNPLTFWQAAAFQWVNPKAWVMVTTALTVYALPLDGVWPALGAALVFACVGTVTATSWTALGDRLRLFFEDSVRLRAFNICAAVVLLLTLVPVFWPGLL